ncbi:MAG: hypothetical protein KBT87_10865 [Gammaproteobacteria bacterium]|nr:hypothetical protein [Gammaproteobacteria bacterium]MBQ0775164.1 hypothetical protein [Gammaproteobacteria bacterium]
MSIAIAGGFAWRDGWSPERHFSPLIFCLAGFSVTSPFGGSDAVLSEVVAKMIMTLRVLAAYPLIVFVASPDPLGRLFSSSFR